MVNIKNYLVIGNKINYLNEPYLIEFVEFIKPGKCKPFVRLKIRNLINLKLIDKTFKYLNNIKVANILNYKCNYIYKFRENFYFLNKNFDQIIINKNIINKNEDLLHINNKYNIIFWNNKPINLIVPRILIVKVCSIILNKDNKLNLAKLYNNLIIKVPYFIKKGDLIKININKLYISRL